jgi:hypothetical protein
MRALRLLSLALVAPAALAAQSEQSVAGAVNSITEADVAHRVGVIAHDSMGGRNTPSPGLDLTAQWVADEFERFGLAPGGDDGSYLQRYPLLWMQVDTAHSMIAVEGGPSWRLGSDFARRGGATTEAGSSGSAVVVHGAEGGADAVASLPLEGKVVFMVPPQDGQAGLREFQRMIFTAWQMDPAAVIAVVSTADRMWQRQLRGGVRARMQVGSPAPTRSPLLMIQGATAAPVLAQHGFELGDALGAAAPVTAAELPGLEITVSMPERVIDEQSAPNTVGILEGSDPQLKNEYIVFSAHMDHVGTAGDQAGGCTAVAGDAICNGADDDASGTVAIVELAEAFAMLEPRPRRSMIFVTVSGEEKGLWGSAHFAENPPVPVEQLVANFNADMIGRNWTDTISVIGKEHSDLGETLHRVADEHPELDMVPVDDQWPNENFYRRSDHFNFARRGVPVLFFFNGTHQDYHRPGDEPDKIDAEKEARIVKLMFYVGLEVANADEKPQWNPESYAEIVRPGGTD